MPGAVDLCIASVVQVFLFGWIVRSNSPSAIAVAAALLPAAAFVLQCAFDEGARCRVDERDDTSFTVSAIVQRLPAYFFFGTASAVWALVASSLWWGRGARLQAAVILASALVLTGLPLRSGLEQAHNYALFIFSAVLVVCVVSHPSLRTRPVFAHLAVAIFAGAFGTYAMWNFPDSRMWKFYGLGAEIVALAHSSALFI